LDWEDPTQAQANTKKRKRPPIKSDIETPWGEHYGADLTDHLLGPRGNLQRFASSDWQASMEILTAWHSGTNRHFSLGVCEWWTVVAVTHSSSISSYVYRIDLAKLSSWTTTVSSLSRLQKRARKTLLNALR
jgi:hypothetical protein